jgi:hypothetical protein
MTAEADRCKERALRQVWYHSNGLIAFRRVALYGILLIISKIGWQISFWKFTLEVYAVTIVLWKSTVKEWSWVLWEGQQPITKMESDTLYQTHYSKSNYNFV